MLLHRANEFCASVSKHATCLASKSKKKNSFEAAAFYRYLGAVL
jgi:hypothetical protein